jgi:hypothetical protein
VFDAETIREGTRIIMPMHVLKQGTKQTSSVRRANGQPSFLAHSGQNGDDRNNHQEFDERKTWRSASRLFRPTGFLTPPPIPWLHVHTAALSLRRLWNNAFLSRAWCSREQFFRRTPRQEVKATRYEKTAAFFCPFLAFAAVYI